MNEIISKYMLIAIMNIFTASHHRIAYAHKDSYGSIQHLNQFQNSLRLAHGLITVKGINDPLVNINHIIDDPIKFLKNNLDTFNVDLGNIDNVKPKCSSQFQRWTNAMLNITNNPQQWAINGDLSIYFFKTIKWYFCLT